MKQRILGIMTVAVVALLTAASCTSRAPSPTPTIVVSPSPSAPPTRPAFTPPVRTPVAVESPTPTVAAVAAIRTTSLPAANVGMSYKQTLAAEGGTFPYSWSVTTGALPPGLILTASTGVISGTPTGTGTSNFTVTVTDAAGTTAAQALSITVNAAPVTPLALSQGDVGLLYTHYLATGTSTSIYTWTITAGALPPGLVLDYFTSIIAGTPTSAGTYNFTAEMGGLASGKLSIPLTLTINPAPVLTTAILPSGSVGASYVTRLAVSGGTTPYKWSLDFYSAALPEGLSLDQFGLLVGTPAAAGTYNFTVNMKDAAGAERAQTLTLQINPAPTPAK